MAAGRRGGGRQRKAKDSKRVAAPMATITWCTHEAFGTPDFYFTALMIAHSFQKAAAKKKGRGPPLGGVQLISVSEPLLGPGRGTLSASPLPGCAGLR